MSGFLNTIWKHKADWNTGMLLQVKMANGVLPFYNVQLNYNFLQSVRKDIIHIWPRSPLPLFGQSSEISGMFSGILHDTLIGSR